MNILMQIFWPTVFSSWLILSRHYHEQRKFADMDMSYSEVQTMNRKKPFPSLRIRPTPETKKRFDELCAKYSAEIAVKTLVEEAMDEINAVTERPRTELLTRRRKRTGPFYNMQYSLPVKPDIGAVLPTPPAKVA